VSKKRRLAYLALLGNTLIWGAAFPIIKPALAFHSPYEFLFLRYAIAAPLILPILVHAKVKFTLPIKKKILPIIALEVIGVPLLLSLVYTALDHTTALSASLIGLTSPLFTIIAGVLFLKERETTKELKGLFIALIGTLILTLSPVFKSALPTGDLVGNSLMFLYNILWALYLILAKKLYSGVPKILVSTISMWIGLFFFGGLVVISGGLPHFFLSLNPSTLIAGGYMGILGSIIALTLYLYGQDKIEASEASLFTYLQAVVAIPTAYLLLHELPSPWQIVGALTICLGVYIGESKFRKKRMFLI